MFSKALFRQSSKANGMRWTTITLATCLMLMVIIIVLGSINVVGIRDSLTQVFTSANEEALIKENAVDSYDLYLDSVDVQHALTGLSNGNQSMEAEDEESFGYFWNFMADNYEAELENFESDNSRVPTAEEKETLQQEYVIKMMQEFEENDVDIQSLGIDEDTAQELLLSLVKAYDGNSIKFTTGKTAEFFTEASSILEETYLAHVYNVSYKQAGLREGATEEFCMATAAKMSEMAKFAMNSYSGDGINATYSKADYFSSAATKVQEMLTDMSVYIAPQDYTQDQLTVFKVSVKVIVGNAINTYQTWLDEGVEQAEARNQATISISDQIPPDVQKTLHDLGNMDISGLIVGSMFYKMAGILLPMVFVITTANGLLAGQVDSGSMAYVLSTPTKRRTVTFTQMIYLIVSVFVMYALLTASSVLTLVIVGKDFGITVSELLLLNLGAFVTMIAISGFCFMCSAIFNRSKHSMSAGGGLSIFFLVCTILGLFGSSAMPEALRISAMDAFNYLSLISLFDTTAILSGGLDYIWKLAILAVVGIVCFVVGIIRFEKKDLPL